VRRVVLTGATGFVGANLAKLLIETTDIELCITVRKSSDFWRISQLRGSLHRIDLVDLGNRGEVSAYLASLQPEIIIHSATYGGFPQQKDAEQIVRINLQAAMYLLDGAVACGARQFINTGSSSEYGIKHAPMKEDDICQPVSLYGITKLAATHYCTLIGQTTALRTCTLRLFSPYGPLEDPSRLYPSIVNALQKNEPPHLSRPDSVRDFIPIEQVADIYIRMMQAEYESGSVINVGSGKQQTIRQFFVKIAALLNKSHIQPLWGQAEMRAYEPQFWQADITKLMQILPSCQKGLQ